MRVIALGGAGGMGRAAVRALAASDLVTEIIIADKNVEAAQRLAAEVGGKASARETDAGDEERLGTLIEEGDIVVNTCGPFFKFGVSAVRAAIRAGRNYCDINDDWRPTQEVLEMDAEAKAAGITAIVGIGASPGLSNLLARHAAAQLDEVEEIQTCWVAGGGEWEAGERGDAGGGELAALEHMMHSASGKIPTFRDGKWVEIGSFESGEEVSFPGTGPYTVFHIGHPEPVTLPRFIPSVKTVSNLGALYPPQLNDLVREQVRRMAAGKVDARQAAIAFVQAVASDPQRWLAGPVGAAPGGLCAVARGRKNGRRARYACAPGGWPAGAMAGSTGIPLAIAALRVLRGEIRERGVLPPEACTDPMPFFEEYSGYWAIRLAEGRLLLESMDWVE